MFERIAIRRRSTVSLGRQFDLGILAEALLFYGQIRLIANHAVFKSLVNTIGPDALLDLLESDFLQIVYEQDDVAIQTDNTNTPAERHKPIYYSLPHLALQEELPRVLEENFGRSGKARRFAQRLIRKIEIKTYPSAVTEAPARDLDDPHYLQHAVDTLLDMYVPEYSGARSFTAERDGREFVVATDIDFVGANSAYHSRVSRTHSSLSPGYILAHLVSVKADLLYAAEYQSEISIDDVNSAIIRGNVNRVISDLNPSQGAVAAFQEFVFEDSRAIADALRDGRASFAQVIKLLPQAVKFKEWLQTEAPQQDAVKAYFREATSKTWVDKLPTKTLRWFVFTAAGLALDALGAGGVGTTVGVALGATDTFVLDRLLKGWKPTQFVEEQLRPLVSPGRKPGAG